MTFQRAPIRINAVEPLHDYVLRICFSDGSSGDVELEPELRGAKVEPLRDREQFRKVALEPELRTVVCAERRRSRS